MPARLEGAGRKPRRRPGGRLPPPRLSSTLLAATSPGWSAKVRSWSRARRSLAWSAAASPHVVGAMRIAVSLRSRARRLAATVAAARCAVSSANSKAEASRSLSRNGTGSSLASSA